MNELYRDLKEYTFRLIQDENKADSIVKQILDENKEKEYDFEELCSMVIKYFVNEISDDTDEEIKIDKKPISNEKFSSILLELEDSLNRFAYSLTSNESDAKDLVQETFLKALSYKEQCEYNTNMRAWAFAIMRNTFINNYCRHVKHATTFDFSDNQFIINSNSELTLTAIEISNKIESLEPEFRIPFQMHTSGYKYKEIADSLNLKVGTVKSRIFFARQKLMDVLKDYEK